MDARLFCEILSNLLEHQRCEVTFPDFDMDAVNTVALDALSRIRKLVESPRLSAPDCYKAIRGIIAELEDAGIFVDDPLARL